MEILSNIIKLVATIVYLACLIRFALSNNTNDGIWALLVSISTLALLNN